MAVVELIAATTTKAGLKVETDNFAPLLGSPISRNLIAVFFMTTRLQKDPGVADPAVKPRDVQQVGVSEIAAAEYRVR